MPFDRYAFLLRKHFYKLDSTCVHFHLAKCGGDIKEIEKYFNEVAAFEDGLKEKRYKGSYKSIIAVCFVDDFDFENKVIDIVSSIWYIQLTPIISVVVNSKNGKVYMTNKTSILQNRAKAYVKSFVLDSKKMLKNIDGDFETDQNEIEKREQALAEMDIKTSTKKPSLSQEDKEIFQRLKSGEFWTREIVLDEEGIEYYKQEGLNVSKEAAIYYKNKEKGTIFYTPLITKDDGGMLCSICTNISWIYPSTRRMNRLDHANVLECLKNYLKANNVEFELYAYLIAPDGTLLKTTPTT